MAGLRLHMLVSVDGFMADQGGTVIPGCTWDEKVQRFYSDFFEGSDGVIFGRKIYNDYVGHWIKVANEKVKAQTGDELRWTRRLRDMPKYVVSNSLKKAANNTIVLKKDLLESIRKLKDESERGLLLICGPALVGTLTAAQLIDEYILYVCPSVAGKGRHLFSELTETQPDRVVRRWNASAVLHTGIQAVAGIKGGL